MTNNMNSSNTTSSETLNNMHGLVWNIDLTLEEDSNKAAQQRRQAIDQARASRPRTAKLEREIIIAVIVLYVLILGSFAALHLYGEHTLPAQNIQTSPSTVGAQQ